LLGEWEGVGEDEATGVFKFIPDLSNKILIRKNFTEYPVTNSQTRNKQRLAMTHNESNKNFNDEINFRNFASSWFLVTYLNDKQKALINNSGHQVRY